MVNRGLHPLDDLAQRQLDVAGKAADADPDEPQRAGPVAERAVEERAGELTDPGAVRGADRQRRRTGPDGEVRIPELGGHGPRHLATGPEMLCEVLRHTPQLVVKALRVADVARESLLAGDRDSLRRHLELPR